MITCWCFFLNAEPYHELYQWIYQISVCELLLLRLCIRFGGQYVVITVVHDDIVNTIAKVEMGVAMKRYVDTVSLWEMQRKLLYPTFPPPPFTTFPFKFFKKCYKYFCSGIHFWGCCLSNLTIRSFLHLQLWNFGQENLRNWTQSYLFKWVSQL